MEVWAVINLTPDSFVEESRIRTDEIVSRVKEYFQNGADVIDIGAESSRPFSLSISEGEEWERLKQPLFNLKENLEREVFENRISIDTRKPSTVSRVLNTGVGIINDISGASDESIVQMVSDHRASIVIMHSQGNPDTMQINPSYSDVVDDVLAYLEARSEKCIRAGIKKENIIWDFGIGFGKTLEHNISLLKNISRFRKSGFKLMVGVSRKSFIGKMVGIENIQERKDPTLIIHTLLALKGVDILRVHDVKSAVQVRTILSLLNENN